MLYVLERFVRDLTTFCNVIIDVRPEDSGVSVSLFQHPAIRSGTAWKEGNVAHFKMLFHHMSQRGYTNVGHQVVVATNFMCAVAPNIGGSSGWTLLSVNFLDPRIFRWLLDSWKTCTPFI
jgi:hypothetical protein